MGTKPDDREFDTPNFAIKCAIGYDIFRDAGAGAVTLTARFRNTLAEMIKTTELDLEDSEGRFGSLLLQIILDHVGDMEETELKKVYHVVYTYLEGVYPELFDLYQNPVVEKCETCGRRHKAGVQHCKRCGKVHRANSKAKQICEMSDG